ncbi:hypothetical protein Btru_015845 [Bulinus truncatus]|nr:hypothetical protein Btru_015845 [Bulinus truncatus]
MEMNSWNDYLSPGLEWGLDLLDKQSGPFGDLHLSGQPISDRSFSAQDAFSVKSDPFAGICPEDAIGPEWMESTDIDAYLDTFLYDSTALVDAEGAVNEIKSIALPKINFLDYQISGSDAVESQFSTESDIIALPPDSPAQVAPTNKTDIVPVTLDCHTGLPESYSDYFESSDNTLESFSDPDLSLGDFTLSDYENKTLVISLDTTKSTHNVTVASISSPSNSKKNVNIIQSCPELYKVISASAAEIGKKCSSQTKSKCGKTTPRKGKVVAQPVPEFVIVEQLNKKDRKKLQNKNAAIRYRQKKKEEAKEIKSEEQILEEHNSKLRNKVEDLQREIKYMKNLMDDVRRAKGLL